MTDGFDESVAYRGRIMSGVIAAVVDAGTAPGAEGGMVDLDSAIDALCDTIALFVAGGGQLSPTERRDLAERCRNRILMASNETERRRAAGEALPWTMDAIGKPN